MTPRSAGSPGGSGPAGRLPVVVVAGRSNVGKSTLVNRIVGRRAAIVEEHPGVTRDRLELEASWVGRSFVVIDTGGVVTRGDSLDLLVSDQAETAIDQADVVLFVTDATTGVTVEDGVVAETLRRKGRAVIVVANKVDSAAQEPAAWELASLGLGDPEPVSALHGRGVGDLLDRVVTQFPAPAGAPTGGAVPEAGVPGGGGNDTGVVASVTIVGRPNVGKSTLFNRLVGAPRAVVHELPGTTRDAIDTVVETAEGRIRFVDTAGLRRKSRIGEGPEYFSLVRSLAAIDRSDVAILVLDAGDGVTHQDQRLAERIDAAGSPIVVALNKWDLVPTAARPGVTADVAERLAYLAYAPVLRLSALTGRGVHRLVPALRAAIDAYHRRIPTGVLNEALRAIQAAQAPPRSRILYAVQGAINPPTVTLFVSRRLPPGYLRYVERSLRARFDLGPTPLKLRVRLRGS
ncbi:MAG TPA: ribosome biogenesis GTPase Der [Acidimicrobiales bacterium]|nr:ribosome biogenesis GTPase Der [Acidimicrobiales bacterium]